MSGNEEQSEPTDAGGPDARPHLAAISDGLADAIRAIGDLDRRIQLSQAGQTEGDTRWEQRVGAIEERLVDLDESLRAEVERVRSTASVLDLLANEFRSTMGDTRDLAEVARQLSDRIGELESAAAAAAQASTAMASLEGRISEVTEITGAGMTELIARIDGGMAFLEARLTEAAESNGVGIIDLEGRIDAGMAFLEGRLADSAETSGLGLNELIERIGGLNRSIDTVITRVTDRDDADTAYDEAVIAAFDEVSGRIDRLELQVGRSADALDDMDLIRSSLVEILNSTATIDEMSGQLAQIRASQPDVDAVRSAIRSLVERMGEQLSPLLQSLRTTDARVGSLETFTSIQTDALTALSGEVGQVRESIDWLSQRTPAVEEQVTHLIGTVGDLTNRISDPEVLLDRIQGVMTHLEEQDLSTAAVAGRVDDATAATSERFDALAGAVSDLEARLGELTSAVDPQGPLRGIVSDVGTRLETLTTAIGSLHRHQPDLPAELDGVAARLETGLAQLGAELDQAARERDAELQTAVRSSFDQLPDPAAAVAPVSAGIDELLAERHDLNDALARLAERTENAIASSRSLIDDRLGAFDTARFEDARQLAEVVAGMSSDSRSMRTELEELVIRLNALDIEEPRAEEMTNELRERLDAAAADLAGRLGNVSDVVGAALADREPDLSPIVVPMVEGLDRLQETTEETLTRMEVVRASSLAAASIGPRLDEIADSLDGRLAALAEGNAATRARIDDLGPLVDSLEAGGQVLRGELIDAVRTVEQQARNHHEEAARLLGELTERSDRVATAQHTIGEDLRLASEAIGEIAGAQPVADVLVGQVDERLGPRIEDLRVALREAVVSLDEAAIQRAASTDAVLGGVTPQLEIVAAAVARNQDSLNAVPETLARIAAATSQLDELATIRSSLAEVAESVESVDLGILTARLVDLDERVQGVGRAVASVSFAPVLTHLDEVAEQLTAHGEIQEQELRVRLQAAIAELVEAGDGQRQAVEQRLDAAIGDLAERLYQRADEHDRALEEQVGGASREVAEALSTTAGASVERIQNRIDEAAARLVGAVNDDRDDQHEFVAARLNEMVAAVGELVTERGDRHDRFVEQRLGTVAKGLAERLDSTHAVADALGAQLSSLHAALAGGADAGTVRSELDGALDQLAERLGSALREIRSDVLASGTAGDPNTLRASLEAGLDRLSSRLEGDVARILAALAAREDTSADRLRRIDGTLAEVRRELEVLRRIGGRTEALRE